MIDDENDEPIVIDGRRIEAVRGFCSYCGRIGPTEVGCIVSDGKGDTLAHAFCDYDCYAQFNLSHGLGPAGDVLSDIFPCPECGYKHHDSKFISYEPDYEREYTCQRCGVRFIRPTFGKEWLE